MATTSKQKDVKKATLLSLIPGLGQFYNEQKFKGIIFLGVFIAFVIELFTFGVSAIDGFITLGTVPMEDHSLFLLIEGTLQIIITFVFVIFYVFNIK
ncbi:MAG: DUF5683 domain-containing protein, partial [Vagococcus sp.]